MPSRLDIKSPVGEARNEYVYRSDGSKLRVIHRWNPNFSAAPVIGSGITESALTSTETTDYVGNYVYVNNTLKRILTENGYIENQAYSFYVEDHLESARITADASGLRKQTIGDYPYGMQYGDAISTEVQPYKYTAKEYDQMHGLNLYDSKARFYDPALARFTSMDPLAEKYYAWSPYAYGLNNPLRNVDLRGDSITILNLVGGEHSALLIQNDKSKWQYFSMNGNNIYISGKHFGGRKFDDIAVGEFVSPQEFMDSDYNQNGDKDNNAINYYGFAEGYIIPTTTKQDNAIRETFLNAIQQGYSLKTNHCAIAVQKSLNAAGIETRNSTIKIINSKLGNIEVRINPYLPSNAYKAIIKNNPQGYSIQRKK